MSACEPNLGSTERDRVPPVSRVLVSDTTLRDGEQMPGGKLNVDDKVFIASALASAGVDSIEAGFPASSKEEAEAVRQVASSVAGPAISALCRVTKEDIDCAAAALEPAAPFKRVASLFIATSPLHRKDKLGLDQYQIIERVSASIRYAREYFHHVVFSAEDATRTEPLFLAELFTEAIAAGASVVCFPDTVGVMTPEKVRSLVRLLVDRLPKSPKARLAAHFHNDLGLATANTLAAITEGVRVIQCTVNGIGERAGNASLEEVLVALHVNRDQFPVRTGVRLDALSALSKLVSERTGIPVAPNKAVVGTNVFCSAAGIHQDGLLKNPETYLPFPPELVGADPVRFVLDKHSGRAAIAAELRRGGMKPTDRMVEAIYKWLKGQPKGASKPAQVTIKNALEGTRAEWE